jgi:predicted RNA-binding Zn-ribbon protein involved in translation (DUF1610 family)
MNYVVISNAVIDSPNASGVRYKYKCDSCGLIQGGFSSSSANPITSHFKCTKCGSSNNVLIKKL